MEYVFIILVAFLGVFIWFLYIEKTDAKKLRVRLKEEWGNISKEQYTDEKFKLLKSYYNSMKTAQADVDDITWNDLDMDQIFMLINNTSSAIGEEYLYALLRKPCFTKEELQERDRLIKFFQNNEEKRIKIQMELSKVGKLRQYSVYEYLNKLVEQESKSNLPHYLMLLGLVISTALIFVKPAIGGICLVGFIANNIARYFMEKAKIESFLVIFAYIVRLIDSVKGISKLNYPEISSYTNSLKNYVSKFGGFERGSRLVFARGTTGDIMDIFLDYFRMLFHVDLIKYNSMLNFLKKNRDDLDHIFENVGILDSMISAASFRTLLDYYCEPELVLNSKPYIDVKELYHPLLDNPVTNSISENRSVLITGSNASGKSTFIKTLAMNAILSQTIYTSLSKSYRASFFQIYSSMALRDSILSNESYYIVEIKSLKRILDRIDSRIPTLCFIDEVLRGTNTLERIAASSQILCSLARSNSIVFAATHDIELTHILENYYSNYHFQERIEGKNILFDYRLYKGKAVSKNAIKLLDLLGYPESIIQSAEKAANRFLETGEWSRI